MAWIHRSRWQFLTIAQSESIVADAASSGIGESLPGVHQQDFTGQSQHR
ncbi:MAG: hypothetical protein RLZZ436_949 [Planctomycetota bacterium]